MDKLSIPIFVESRYKINRKRIKRKISDVLSKNQVSSPVEASVAVVGDRKMRQLAQRYKGEDKTRNILSFSQNEGEPIRHAAGKLALGDIVISFPVVINEASRDEMLVDDKIDDLIEHGMMHLLGLHHD